MANTLKDLNDLLFQQINILNDTDVEDSKFSKIRQKADSISRLGDTIIKNSELALKHEIWRTSKTYTKGARHLINGDTNE